MQADAGCRRRREDTLRTLLLRMQERWNGVFFDALQQFIAAARSG